MRSPIFTPGPWKWHTSNSWRRLKREAQGITQNVLEPYVSRDTVADVMIHEADMSLIAAAPDLYAALEQLVDWMGLRDNSGELVPVDKQPEQIAAAMRALAKAEGKDG